MAFLWCNQAMYDFLKRGGPLDTSSFLSPGARSPEQKKPPCMIKTRTQLIRSLMFLNQYTLIGVAKYSLKLEVLYLANKRAIILHTHDRRKCDKLQLDLGCITSNLVPQPHLSTLPFREPSSSICQVQSSKRMSDSKMTTLKPEHMVGGFSLSRFSFLAISAFSILLE